MPHNTVSSQSELPAASLPSAAEYRRQRIAQDFYRQALVGPLFYVLGAILATQSDAELRQHWPLSLLFPVLMALLALLRWLNRPPAVSADEPAFKRWYQQRWWLIFVGSASWAIFAGIVTINVASNASANLLVVLCTVAFGAASASAFAFDLRRTLLSIGLLLLPQIVILLTISQDQPVAIMLIIFLCYLLVASRRYSRDYHSQLELEYNLLSSRAEIHQLSQLDELTGLYNRRRFNEIFQCSWQQAQRTQSPLCLVLVDIDHFKAINDQFGHQIGDLCLQVFARELRQRFRRLSDHAMRIGGEEFAVVLPGTGVTECLRLAEETLADLRQHPIQTAAGDITLQASFGIASLAIARAQHPDDTFKRADVSLYAAKQAGRARAFIAD